MKRYPEILLILVLLLALTILWAWRMEDHKPYKEYQRIYKTRKLAQLEERLTAGPSAEDKDKLMKEIKNLRRDSPHVREVTLPGNRRERCLSCHIGLRSISASHPVGVFGCTVCHGGDPLSVTLPAAHKGMIGGRNPSDFRYIDQSCGRTMPDGTACHNGDPREERNHIGRVKTTIMATKAGEAALVRYSFGLQKSLAAQFGTTAVQGKASDRKGAIGALLPLPYGKEGDLPLDAEGSPIRFDPTGTAYTFSGYPLDTKLHDHCLNRCHLWTEGKKEPYLARASGCASCHYLYNDSSYYEGDDPTLPRDEPGHGRVHELTLKIPYSQCNHCHNRGVHSLQRLEFDGRADLSGIEGLPLEKRREKDYYNPMTLYTRCEVELDCIDCHTDREVMGDGVLYSDKSAQQRIRCFTCHGTLARPPILRRLTAKESPKVQRIMRTYGRKAGEEGLFTSEGEFLPHVRVEGKELVLQGKVTGKRFELPLVFGSACRQTIEAQDANSCHVCHDVHVKKK